MIDKRMQTLVSEGLNIRCRTGRLLESHYNHHFSSIQHYNNNECRLMISMMVHTYAGPETSTAGESNISIKQTRINVNHFETLNTLLCG